MLNWLCDEHQVAKNEDQLMLQASEERSHTTLESSEWKSKNERIKDGCMDRER